MRSAWIGSVVGDIQSVTNRNMRCLPRGPARARLVVSIRHMHSTKAILLGVERTDGHSFAIGPRVGHGVCGQRSSSSRMQTATARMYSG
jgi:hypothetical protein